MKRTKWPTATPLTKTILFKTGIIKTLIKFYLLIDSADHSYSNRIELLKVVPLACFNKYEYRASEASNR